MKIKGKFIFQLISLLLGTASFAQVKSGFSHFKYASFRDSIYLEEHKLSYDSTNLFDDGGFIPGKNSFDSLLMKMDLVLKEELAKQTNGDIVNTVQSPYATYNKQSLDFYESGKSIKDEAACRELNCILYAEVVKSEQLMYVYLDGELLDTFPVSTGEGEYETPNLNLRPSGPVFIKYSSKKFPGGNYMGLGNMPYAVFLKGGYAIHGTTTGNIKKLGTKASHGCIRLHPDNARVFNELVRQAGLENTWVKVID